MSWIKGEEFDFNCLLLFERFQIKMILEDKDERAEYSKNLGIALKYNPAIKWYFSKRCPECEDFIEKIVAHAREVSSEEVRKAEIYILESLCDYVVYANPEIMDSTCDWIYAWDKSRLYELVDLKDKIVLDIGSGSGRLAFAAAEKAAWVYASEPVDTLREYMRDKIKKDGITNMRVVDGMILNLPYPDNTFDIVMSAHVGGDDNEAEKAEMTRVCKSGGWIIDCPGEGGDDYPGKSEDNWVEISDDGWECFYYKSTLGGYNCRVRKQIFK